MVRGQRGMATLETLLLSLLLIVPLIWTLVLLATLHRTALAATSAVREAGAAAVRAGDRVAATTSARAAIEMALQDQDVDVGRARAEVVLGDLTRGGEVEVRISYPVRVFSLPFLGRVGGPAVWVRASHVAQLDRYRSR